MKIILVVGSYPPDMCGVGDYTSILRDGLVAEGAQVEIAVWNRLSWPDIARVVRSNQERHIIHFQYPSVGYRYSVVPQFLSVCKGSIATLHEFSQVRVARSLATVPFLWRSYVVFTSSYERVAAIALDPGLASRSEVIPIGSNIRPVSWSAERDMNRILHFGLITPKKGLDRVIQLAAAIKTHSSALRIHVVGNVIPGYGAYAGNLVRKAKDLPIDWSFNLDEAQLSDLFARTAYAYLPFPDGASERRGSLKALLASGVPCITTAGAQTNELLQRAVILADTPSSALGAIENLRRNPISWEAHSRKALAYSETYTWASIARKHVELYERLQNIY